MIDLSKAYAGQIAHLNDGKELTIYSIKENEGKYIITFPLFVLAYDVNGKFLEPIEPKGLHKIPDIDINYLEHDYFAQIARLEGEIKGYENILLCKPAASTFDYICAKRLECIEQLKALQDENS